MASGKSDPRPQPPLRRDEVAACRGACFHPARSAGQADLFRLEGAGAGWVLKDFAARPLAIRLLMTRRALAREARALQALSGLPGVPRLAGRVDVDAIVIEELDAERLPHRNDNFLTPEFFQRLESLVDEMHSAGWAHGDLRRKNILVRRETLEPFLIDFATAWYGGPDSPPWRRFMLRRWRQVDHVTLVRIKQSYLPDSLTDEDRRALAAEPLHLRFGRFLRHNVYRPLKKRNRRKTWRRFLVRLGLRRPEKRQTEEDRSGPDVPGR